MSEKRILILDDEEIIQDISSKIFSYLGFDVVCISDGKDILETYENALNENTPFDLVVSDLTIPNGMSGREANTILKDKYPNAVTVISSGNPEDDAVRNYESFNFNASLVKPFTIDTIKELLKELSLDQ